MASGSPVAGGLGRTWTNQTVQHTETLQFQITGMHLPDTMLDTNNQFCCRVGVAQYSTYQLIKDITS